MKRFEAKEIRLAYRYSQAGGQALLVPEFVCNWPGAPKCFRNKKYGYLFDPNLLRLTETAKRLGVRIIKVDNQDEPKQHINLCGRPLEKAIEEAENKEIYCCPHCGKPTKGRVIGIIGKKLIREMCKECEDFIGSPAAQLSGATMKNRIKMQKLYDDQAS